MPFARRTDLEFPATDTPSNPWGIWSNGTTTWAGSSKILAYNSGDGTRDSAKDIDLAPGITYSVGLWSDGTTLWSVKAGFDDKVFAYELSSGRISARE